MRSAVGAPILVEGRLWGALMAATRGVEPWAENAETRIAAFTELVATAIANAESHESLAELADEQAALRRVATMVAQGASPEGLFASVAEEVGRLLPVDNATMGRYEPDGSVTTVASWSTTEAAFPTGRRWPTKGTNVAWMVLETGRAARIDDFSAATDPIGVAARESGIKSAVGSPIVVEGHVWGVVTATSTEGPLPPDSEARLASFTELVATAVANAESSAEIAASRRRIIAASDDARRRIVRDLHDGAQQRLVHTVITLKLAQQALADGAENGPLLVQEAMGNAEQAMAEVRELAHGILPAVLTRGGLRAGIVSLGSRAPVPVEIDVSVDRLPAPVEATAYFVVAEALTNVAKHSSADHAKVLARIEDGILRVEVRDDGVGGASPDGTGLVGLQDRVEALGGTIEIDSAAGSGTCVIVTLPSATEPG
jgi:signal transduction histidine kinase